MLSSSCTTWSTLIKSTPQAEQDPDDDFMKGIVAMEVRWTVGNGRL